MNMKLVKLATQPATEQTKLAKAIIAVMALTGKVGKSVAAHNLLLPRMPGAKLFRIETINVSGQAGSETEIQQLKGREIEKLLKALSNTELAVVDVGTSNVETFMIELTKDVGAQKMFDFFLVPVESNASKINEFEEFMKTVIQLNKLGVEPSRIKVVFNKHLIDTEVEIEMARVFNFHKKYPIFTLDGRAVIHQTDLFKSLATVKKSFEEVRSDTFDYWKKLRQTPPATTREEEKEREYMVAMHRAQGLVQGVNAELDVVFAVLFGVPPVDGQALAAPAQVFNIAEYD